MEDFPPQDRLRQVAGSLLSRLPEQFGALLAAQRFEEGRGVLERLNQAGALGQGIAAMAPEEAAWLAELLLARWSRIADVHLDPAAAIVGPEEIWVARHSREVEYTVAASGMEDGWIAQWSDNVATDENGRQAILTVHPPEDNTPSSAGVTVRVMGRAQGKRCVIAAHRTIHVRRPVVSVDDSRRRLVISDQAGAPAGGVRVFIGEASHITQSTGLVELPKALSPEASVRVEEDVVRVVSSQ